MYLIDFTRSAARAFAHGFLKGLAAPVMLRHAETMPRVRARIIKTPGPASVEEALARDWRRVGRDICAAIEAYEQEARKTPRSPAKAGR